MAERAVNPRQREVLEWIDDGCPDGVMADTSYKLTAVALQNRRLVTLSRKGGVWKAETTEAGRYFLQHGRYPQDHWKVVAKPASRRRHRSPLLRSNQRQS